jgi:hypothetical protein
MFGNPVFRTSGLALVAPVLALALALVLPARPAAAAGTQLRAGDLMFSGFNADEDGWSLVALVDLAPGTELFFSDNAWNGSAFGSGEGFLRWTSGERAIAAGTWLRFMNIDSAGRLAASSGQLERLSVPGSTLPNLSQTAETLYAYQGGGPLVPERFVAAIGNGGFAGEAGGLAGTGLIAGRQALALPPSTDWAEYAGPRSPQVSGGEAQSRLVSLGLWQSVADGDLGARLPNVAPLDVTPIPEPWAPLLAVLGVAMLWHRHQRPGLRGVQTAPVNESSGSRTSERRLESITKAA